MFKLTPIGVKIHTNLVWSSHNTGGAKFNVGDFAAWLSARGLSVGLL